jgi:hypothetical protein
MCLCCAGRSDNSIKNHWNSALRRMGPASSVRRNQGEECDSEELERKRRASEALEKYAKEYTAKRGGKVNSRGSSKAAKESLAAGATGDGASTSKGSSPGKDGRGAPSSHRRRSAGSRVSRQSGKRSSPQQGGRGTGSRKRAKGAHHSPRKLVAADAGLSVEIAAGDARAAGAEQTTFASDFSFGWLDSPFGPDGGARAALASHARAVANFWQDSPLKPGAAGPVAPIEGHFSPVTPLHPGTRGGGAATAAEAGEAAAAAAQSGAARGGSGATVAAAAAARGATGTALGGDGGGGGGGGGSSDCGAQAVLLGDGEGGSADGGMSSSRATGADDAPAGRSCVC